MLKVRTAGVTRASVLLFDHSESWAGKLEGIALSLRQVSLQRLEAADMAAQLEALETIASCVANLRRPSGLKKSTKHERLERKTAPSLK